MALLLLPPREFRWLLLCRRRSPSVTTPRRLPKSVAGWTSSIKFNCSVQRLLSRKHRLWRKAAGVPTPKSLPLRVSLFSCRGAARRLAQQVGQICGRCAHHQDGARDGWHGPQVRGGGYRDSQRTSRGGREVVEAVELRDMRKRTVLSRVLGWGTVWQRSRGLLLLRPVLNLLLRVLSFLSSSRSRYRRRQWQGFLSQT